jgi:hypothetical protein
MSASRITALTGTALLVGAAPLLLAAENSSVRPGKPVAVFVMIIGLILMVMGWKLYKLMISATGLLTGLYIAHMIGQNFTVTATLQILQILAFAIGGFLLAIPFQKAIVFFLGGLGGSILISQPVALLAQNNEKQLTFMLLATLVGFLLFGILSLYFFKSIIITSTSLIGAFSFLIGIFVILTNAQPGHAILPWVDPSDKGFFFMLLFAFFGIMIQHGINKVYPDKDEEKGKTGDGASQEEST